MSMTDQSRRATCPAWIAELPAATLRRAVVAGCALSWIALFAFLIF